MTDATTEGGLQLSFDDEVHRAAAGEQLVIGRDGDLAIDDPYLHRRFLLFDQRAGLWFVSNVGARLAATVVGTDTGAHAFLAPSSSLPVVWQQTAISFTTPTETYRVIVDLDRRAADGPRSEHPLCAEAQADGVPCTELGRRCETCERGYPPAETIEAW